MSAFAYVLGALAAAAALPVLVLLAQVWAALRDTGASPPPRASRGRVAVLMPAHNEASVIAATLRAVLPQLRSGDRALVVADNCTDDTARLAAAGGAAVLERRDPEHPGKNEALEFGIRWLTSDPPDSVIIVDADCQVEPGAIERLALECDAFARPVQALYLMYAPQEAPERARVAELAWIVKNWVRPLGMRRLSLPCQLMGTGTAFPWRAIAGFRIANAEMAEDYKFGIEMALAGFPALFCPEARVSSQFPATKATERVQRTRWEHGHLSLILRELPRLVACALRRRDLALFGLAMDLMVPPLAFLALALGTIFFGTLALALWTGVVWPLVLAAADASSFATAMVLAWLRWGRNCVPLRSVLAMPLYALAKIPLYLRFVTNRQKVWIKTERI
jgi:cellulose synthase/poly-beta-1,6-N-acetylglucosamine synthase-like glycosyltransferase